MSWVSTDACEGKNLTHLEGESATTTNSEVNHLFNVTPGADFLGKVWPCRKESNASNSNKPEACSLESVGHLDKHCCHAKHSVKTSKLTVAHDSKPLKTEQDTNGF